MSTAHHRPAPLSRRRLGALLGAAAGGAALAGTAAPALAAPAAGDVPAQAEDLLRRLRVPTGPSTADGPVWAPLATGFAGVPGDELPHGTVGGLGGRVVTATTAEEFTAAVGTEEPTIVLVPGTLTLPFGTMVDVASHTTIAGAGRGAEIVGGGLRLPSVRNVVIRNLTMRDSFLPGDWDGKDNDHDGIRVDTSDHVWIDHCEFLRLGDGQVDIRKDSTHVTVSWSIFRDHNKTLGVGWTDNAVTTLTVHHTRFSNTHQRNGSIDQVAAGHMYDNWHAGHSSYGMSARGAGQVLVENSVFQHVRNPLIQSDPESEIHQTGCVFEGTWGSHDDTGETIDPADFYAHAADPTDQVIPLLTRHAGPHARTERAPRTVRVAQDGSGDVASIHAAIGTAWRSPHPVEIVVAPGTYREVPTIWPGLDGLVIRGESGEAAEVVLTYDKRTTDWASLTVLSSEVTLRSLTVENTYPADPGSGEAAAIRHLDDTLALEDVELRGDLVLGDPRR
ncbi:pectinesterase family protein [Brachybacterium sp. YJGR34]|uniref:pectate lyase family protein n=1 Tax=Brachybacterium sp. YJGR34 TaxID=2059911 RepID=UPI000E0BF50E|nr:pectinesterase family protein [Brachybacterium sp. YJGR34]